ncbi:MAG TPA: hypothetical protein VLA36_09810 [Longimicrobiales bacterium]|nr:hypothetical protein [Longimicrobiales bacterium]
MTRQALLTLTLLFAASCTESPATDPLTPEPSFAKGGRTTKRADFTINSGGMSLVSDGKGIYQDDVCGVWGSWTADLTYLAPAYTTVRKAQCADIAPRAATLTLAVRHLSDAPHLDDTESPAGSGVFSVTDVSFGWGANQTTTVNAAFVCTTGIRFSAAAYPGTDDVVREDLGGGLWRMYTRPYPHNRAWCDVNGVSTYWHVDLDVLVQMK